MDLNTDNQENITPGYVVNKANTPNCVLLIHYVDGATGATGAQGITARIVPGVGEIGWLAAPPRQICVRHLRRRTPVGNMMEADHSIQLSSLRT